MVFVEWWLVGRFCLSLLILAAAAYLVWLGRGRAVGHRSALRWISGPLAVFGTLFFLLNVLAAGCQSYSPPAYAPNGRIAARIHSADEGIFGNAAVVELFTAHGLRTAAVFQGPWESVGNSSLHWTSNDALEIRFQNNVFYCGNALGVSVHCIGKITGRVE